MKQRNLFYLVSYLVYLIFTLGKASIEKIAADKVPNWFLEQFSSTFLGSSETILRISFYMIALLESVTAGLLFIGLFKIFFDLRKKNGQANFLADTTEAILDFGLLGGFATFLLLSLGQRISSNFSGAAEVLVYAGVTLAARLTLLQRKN